jgi:protein gp37
MADKSAIEWTDATWNPTTGCDRVSPGCAHCYALDLAARLKRMGAPAYQADGDPRTSGPGFALTLHRDRLEIPLRWTRPRRIFVNSMSDLFHPNVPDDFLDDVMVIMAAAPRHTFQVLTKRPDRMRMYLVEPGRRERIEHAAYHLAPRLATPDWRRIEDLQHGISWPIPNVWLGTSVENARWRTRIDELRQTPAAIRFLSCEPLLGPLNDDGRLDLDGIGWLIAGGESGPEHRPVDPDWIRQLRDESIRQGVPFLFKQWGGRTSKSGGRELDGQTWDGFPEMAA